MSQEDASRNRAAFTEDDRRGEADLRKHRHDDADSHRAGLLRMIYEGPLAKKQVVMSGTASRRSGPRGGVFADRPLVRPEGRTPSL